MNKTELVEKTAKAADVSKKDAKAVIDAAFEAISNELAKGGKVQIAGFGTYEVRRRNARVGVNPSTGASIKIPASKVPAFKPGKALKDAVNKK